MKLFYFGNMEEGAQIPDFFISAGMSQCVRDKRHFQLFLQIPLPIIAKAMNSRGELHNGIKRIVIAFRHIKKGLFGNDRDIISLTFRTYVKIDNGA